MSFMDVECGLMEKRGGKRPGSGAKKKAPEQVRVRTTIQIPVWMVETIDKMAKSAGKTRSTWIMDAITDKLGEGEK